MMSRFLFFVILFSTVLIVGCEKGDDGTTTPVVTITEDDAADMIGNAVAGSLATNGITAQIAEAATVAGGGSLSKQLFDTVIVRQRSVANYSYNYTFRYSHNFFNFGDSLVFTYTMKGIYDTPRMSSDDSASAGLYLSHILPPDTVYTMNGSYTRLGSQTSKLRGKNQFTSTVTLMLNNLQVGKSSKKVLSGQMTVTFTARNSDGTSFSYSGTLTFIGDQLASLIINDQTYSVDLATGQVTLESDS